MTWYSYVTANIRSRSSAVFAARREKAQPTIPDQVGNIGVRLGQTRISNGFPDPWAPPVEIGSDTDYARKCFQTTSRQPKYASSAP